MIRLWNILAFPGTPWHRPFGARTGVRPGQVCAIDPKRRAEYADLVARLLKPNGMYIDLAFPLDQRKGGPPFAVSPLEILDLFQARGFKLISRDKPADSISARWHAEELFLFQKAVTEKDEQTSRL